MSLTLTDSTTVSANRTEGSEALSANTVDTMKRFSRSELVQVQSAIAGHYALVETTSGRIHQLNETASVVWDHCDGAHTVEMMANILANRYDVTRAQAFADASALTLHLCVLGLVRPLGGADACTRQNRAPPPAGTGKPP